MVRFKPCPFCGGEAEYVIPLRTKEAWGIRCKRCGCNIRIDYRGNAVWNQRIDEGEEIMSEIITKAVEKITSQQPKERNEVWMVGEQLKDFARDNEKDAELILRDLDVEEMSLVEAEKKIKEYADENRSKSSGKCVCVPPLVAEEILRKFYGLSDGVLWGKYQKSVRDESGDGIKTDKSVSVSLDDFF